MFFWLLIRASWKCDAAVSYLNYINPGLFHFNSFICNSNDQPHVNRLQFEKSPYLLQHKDNPVDWYPWGQEAIERAQSEDKPILVSIGYSSCHWCHVMEHESFSDSEVSAYMNAHFICIKLDREERPDLDKIYMDAVISISGSGGWPLNCFLLPDLRPFYGGTYFPPVPQHQRPSWSQILQFITRIYRERRSDIEAQADRMVDYIKNAASTLRQVAKMEGAHKDPHTTIGILFSNLSKRFDHSHGGFGGAPKFPGTMSIKLLFDLHFFGGNKDALTHALFSLTKIANAGIYDHVAGGFARYATDKEWNIPHFEKMLYDNAQFISTYSIAYKINPNPLFRKVVFETTSWLKNSLKSADGGYFSAIDADSEGIEGKYYTWTTAELKAILTLDEYDLMIQVFDIYDEGNWEDPFHHSEESKNILWINPNLKDESIIFTDKYNYLIQKLNAYRATRTHPLIDTKIIVAWNGLLILGWLDAYAAFNEEEYFTLAKQNLDFILNTCFNEGTYLHQIGSSIPAMLDDIAYTIKACMAVHQFNFESYYLEQAKQLTEFVLSHYFNPSNNSFKYSVSLSDLIAVPDDLYDNTMPSSAGVMAENLVKLGRLTSNIEMERIGELIISDLEGSIIKYTESLSHWASLLLCQKQGWIEIKTDLKIKPSLFADRYIPHLILNRSVLHETGFSLCHQFTCEMPVDSFQKIQVLLDKHYSTYA